MSNAKIRVKVGSMELEYEGDPSFLTGGIEALLMTMGELSGKVPEEIPPTTLTVESPQPNGDGAPNAGGCSNFSTNTIAAHFDAKSGSELAVCAAAHREFVQKKSSSTRIELLAEMRTASNYYNKNMGSNLSSSLKTLVKAKRLHEGKPGTYSLSAAERKIVEAKIAEIE